MLLWFAAGCALILLELLTPTFVLMFFGLGAWGSALMAHFYPGSVQEVITFIVITMFSLFFLRNKMKKTFLGFQAGRQTASPAQNFSYIGKQAVVSKEISPQHEGEVFVGGSYWKAKSESTLPKNSTVIIESQDADDNLVLLVRPQ